MKNSSDTAIELLTLGAVVFLVIRLQSVYQTVQQFQPLIDKLKSTGLLSRG